MKRLIHTSAGPAVLELNRLPGIGPGIGVQVTRFDPVGWEDEGGSWWEKTDADDQTLADFLAVELGVPESEASALADDILGRWIEEWESRAGQQAADKLARLALLYMAGKAALVVLLIVAIGFLIWLLVT